MLPGTIMNEERKQLYYERGDWTDLTVFDYFLASAKRYPEQIAVVDSVKRLSYQQLLEAVHQVANGLQCLNIQKGDFVSSQLPNRVESIIVYLACTKIGAIYNPIPSTSRHQELKYIVGLCESKALFIPDAFRGMNYIELMNEIQKEMEIPNVIVVKMGKEPMSVSHSYRLYEDLLKLPELETNSKDPVLSDDPLTVLFTSGTESNPKGVVHSHNTVLFCARAMSQVLSVTKDDAVFMPSPLAHATGFLQGVNLPLSVGAKTVLMDHFSAKAGVELIVSERCTFSMGATPFLHDILGEIAHAKKNYDLTHFRFFLCGGAPVARSLLAEASKIGFKVLGVFGSSESPPHTVGRLDDSDEIIASSDGKPLPGVEEKIVDDARNPLPLGEIGEEASRGPNVFLGYYKHPELTHTYLDDEGWYYSGDLCYLQPNNYIRVVGRKKDIIIRGGQNISPSEVEDILLKHPKVKNVAIVGIPDERLGERACALVVPNEGENFTFGEMIEFLSKENIAKYKYPEKLQLLEQLPITPSGKIQKYKLRELLKEKTVHHSRH